MDKYEIIDCLRSHATEDAEPMAAYMRDQFKFLGIKSVARRKLTQHFFREAKQTARKKYQEDPTHNIIDWDLVKLLWQQSEREFQYVACDYLKEMKQYMKQEDIQPLKELIISKSWWDSVDALVKTVGYLAHKYVAVKEILVSWSQADNIWLRRTAILHQLTMKDKTDTNLLQTIIENNLFQEEFFINKAIGWALRDYAKTNPDWVVAFLEQHRDDWSPLTWREASKHLKLL